MPDPVHMHEGQVLLFQRSGIWQARIYLGDRRYLWRSLKTPKLLDARTKATELYYQIKFKGDMGLAIQDRTFSSVIDEYVQHREHDHDVGKAVKAGSHKHTSPHMLREIKRVSEFWLEYAGNKPLSAANDHFLRDYLPWRKAYYHNKPDRHPNTKLHPTDKTLQWEIMLGKAIISYAHERGYRGKEPLPSFSFAPKALYVRPAFTIPEYRQLFRTMRKRIYRAQAPVWRYTRELLRNYVLILANSGIRVGEANNLRVRDVVPFKDQLGRSNVQLHVRGKTGARVVIPRVAVAHYVNRVLKLRGNPGADDWLFAMPNGSQVKTLAEQFNAALAEAGIEHNSAGEKYTLYSLRHFYAVQAIVNNINIHTIARNMGTSVEIIQEYYGKAATPTVMASVLGGR